VFVILSSKKDLNGEAANIARCNAARKPKTTHEDRTHLGLAKDTPAGRATEIRSAGENKIQSFPRLGGLHHRYALAA
jgi:hypothetical protein